MAFYLRNGKGKKFTLFQTGADSFILPEKVSEIY